MVALDEINIQESSNNQKSITLIFFINNWFISNQPSDGKVLSNFQVQPYFIKQQ